MNLLTRFFLFTYALSWSCFIAVAIISHSSAPLAPELQAVQQLLLIIGTFAPALVAMWLAYRRNQTEAKVILARVVQWRVHPKWYFFAVFYFLVVKFLVALAYLGVTGDWPAINLEQWYLLPAAIFVSTWVQAGEEIGWRGFALPRLTEKFGLTLSTLLLGALWAGWHLPLFFVKEADKFGQSFLLYLLQVMAVSIALGYLYWKTNGSLLLCMLLHAAMNNTRHIVSSLSPGATDPFGLSQSLVGWLTVIFLWVFAVFFLLRMRNVNRLL